jgi:hypothetical protein
VVLYEMLCGRTPFVGKSYPEVLGQILEGKYRRPSELRPDVPPEIEAAIARALSRDIEARYPTAAAMRTEISAGQAEITLAPVPLGAPAEGAPPQLAPIAAPPVADDEPLSLIERAPAPRPAGRRGHAPGADPFAPPPEAELAPDLAVDRSVSMRPSPSRSRPEPVPYPPEPSVPLARSRPARLAPEAPVRRASAVPVDEGILPAAPEPRKRRPWLLIASGLLGLAIAARVAYSFLGSGGQVPLLSGIGAKQQISLVVEPKAASVQIDHVPVKEGLLPIDTGRPHVLNAAAPGRITRRFSFQAKPGMKLAVRLSHTLEVPGPTDPPPLPAELDTDYPGSPRPAEEIDEAFAKLRHYADCLPLLDDQMAEGKKSRTRPRDELLEPCKLAVTEAADSEPVFAGLQSTGEAYLDALSKGARPEALAKMAAAFRGEYLAARSIWQIEELSRQEKDEGQGAPWHMRRVALATQAWLRSRRATPAAPQVVESRRAKLDAAFASFMTFVRRTPQALAQTSGATDFVSAAEEAVALANGAGGRKPTEFSALDATRRVIATFNALVVE